MEESKRAEISKIIQEKLAEIKSQLKASESDSKPVDLESPIGRLSRMDAIQQQEMAQAARLRLGEQSVALEAAAKRIESEDFGLCMQCGDEIAYKRLYARPESTLCIECQEESS